MKEKIEEVLRLLKELEKEVSDGAVMADVDVQLLAGCKKSFSTIRGMDIFNERKRRRPLQELRVKWSISPARCSQIYKDVMTNTHDYYRQQR